MGFSNPFTMETYSHIDVHVCVIFLKPIFSCYFNLV